MYFYGYFFIKFFVRPRQAEAVTWENAKRDLGCTKEGFHLAGMKRFTCNRIM